MADLRLVHYIEKELNKGFDKDRIKQALVRYSYNENSVDECFSYIEAKKKEQDSPAKELQAEPPAPAESKSLLPKKLITALVVFIFILFCLFILIKALSADEDKTEPSAIRPPLEIEQLSIQEEEDLYKRLLENCIEKWQAAAEDECIELSKLEGSKRTEGMFSNNTNCSSLSEDMRMQCMAFVNKDPDYCARKEGCSQEAYEFIALKTLNSKYCEKLTNPYKKENCIKRIKKLLN